MAQHLVMLLDASLSMEYIYIYLFITCTNNAMQRFYNLVFSFHDFVLSKFA